MPKDIKVTLSGSFNAPLEWENEADRYLAGVKAGRAAANKEEKAMPKDKPLISASESRKFHKAAVFARGRSAGVAEAHKDALVHAAQVARAVMETDNKEKGRYIEGRMGQVVTGFKDYLDDQTGGRVHQLRAALDIQVGAGPVEKAQMALNKLFVPNLDGRGVSPFKGLREAAQYYTGHPSFDPDRPVDFSKIVPEMRSAMAEYHTGAFPLALANALNLFLSLEYRRFDFHEEALISQKTKVSNFHDVSNVQIGYFPDLPEVDPEAGDFFSMATLTESNNTFRVSTRAAILKISGRAFTNDAIGAVKAFVSRAAYVARKTHARYLWNFFINNATAPDGTSWFTALHGNLGNGALAFDTLETALTALATMQEMGPSTDVLGIDLGAFGWRLVVPTSAWATGVKMNRQPYSFTANDLTTMSNNAACGLFGEKSERVIACPFQSDTNDWGVLRDPAEVPIVDMAYMNGREEPEFILADKEINEKRFVSDELWYKLRHEYGGALGGHEGGYKAVVV